MKTLLAWMLVVLTCTSAAYSAKPRITGVLESYEGALPSAPEVFQAAMPNIKESLLEIKAILKNPEKSAVWPGAILAWGMVGSRAERRQGFKILVRLESFLKGKPFSHSTTDNNESDHWEDRARLTVPASLSYLVALDPQPSHGNEPHGRSAQPASPALDALTRIVTGEIGSVEWRAGHSPSLDSELRFRAVRALADCGRDDALGRLKQAAGRVADPALRSEIDHVLSSANTRAALEHTR